MTWPFQRERERERDGDSNTGKDSSAPHAGPRLLHRKMNEVRPYSNLAHCESVPPPPPHPSGRYLGYVYVKKRWFERVR